MEDDCIVPKMLRKGTTYYSGGAEYNKGDSNYNPNKIGGIGIHGGDTGDGSPLEVPDCPNE